MKREILFRGKSHDGKKWQHGDLVHDGEDCYIFPDGAANSFDGYQVDPLTVGQFTGLVDKNGERIFEGDVLKVGTSLKYVVSFEIGCFILRHTKLKEFDGSMLRWGTLERMTEIPDFPFEVVGNIHDNPELLKGGQQ